MRHVFFIFNIVIALLGHFLMFLIWRYFFSFTDVYLQIALAFIVFCGLILLIIAPLLIHWRDNIFSRALYVVAGLWAGLMLNTSLIAIFYFLLKLLSLNNIIDAQRNGRYLYILIIPLAMLLFEFYCARRIKIKNRVVKIKNLPLFWQGKKIIHVSDVHLGPVWRQKFFDDLSKLINKQKADLVFITGDLFDGMDADFSWLHLPKLKSRKGVFYSYGNHDLILGKNKIIELLEGSGIEILADELKEIEGLQVIGISCYYKGRLDVKKKLNEMVSYNPKKPSILMYHEPKDVKAFKEMGIDFQLSGHTHGGQMFPFNFLADILYKGFSGGFYCLDGFNLSVTNGVGTWGPPLRLGSRSEIVVFKLLSA